jgi:hypothetical protein
MYDWYIIDAQKLGHLKVKECTAVVYLTQFSYYLQQCFTCFVIAKVGGHVPTPFNIFSSQTMRLVSINFGNEDEM